jgi:tetratricopeptide (TPR) repeat protein
MLAAHSSMSACGPDTALSLLARLQDQPSEPLTAETVRCACKLAQECLSSSQKATAVALYDATFVHRDPGTLVCGNLDLCGAVLRAEIAAFDPRDLEAAAHYFSQLSEAFAARMGAGAVRVYQLRFEEAESEFREASRLVDATEATAEKSALAWAAICRSLCLQDQHAKAAEAFEKELLPKATAVFGPKSLTVARCRVGLGRCFLADLRAAQAERELSAALLTLRRLLGPTHPETMRVSGSLVDSLVDQPAAAQAAYKLHRELLALQERELGRLHPDVLCTRRVQLDSPQRRVSAEDLATAAALTADHVQVFGREHVYTGLAVLLEGRARFHFGKQELPAALELTQQAMAILSRTAGELRFCTLLARATIGDILTGLRRYREASAALQELATLLRRAHPTRHPHTATALENAAVTLRSSDPGDGSTAPEVERLYREALQELKALCASNSTYTTDLLRCYRNLFLAVSKQPSRDADAVVVMLECLTLHRKALGAEHLETLWCVVRLAAAMIPSPESPLGDLERQQAYEAIVTLLQSVLPALQRTFPPEHRERRLCYHTLAGCYWKLGRREEAKQMEAQLETPPRDPKSWRWNAKYRTPLLKTTGLLLVVGVVAAVAWYGFGGSRRLQRLLYKAL